MDEHVDEFRDDEIPKAGWKGALSQSGLVMSILGFVGVAALIADLFSDWIQIDRHVDPLKFLGGSAGLLVLGSIFSKLFGSEYNQRGSRSLFQGALLILIPVGALMALGIGAVFWFLWQLMEK